MNLFRNSTLPTNLVSYNAAETFTGTTQSTNSDGWFQLVPKTGSSAANRAGSGVSDYDTHMVIGSPDGHLSSFSALPMPYDLTVTDEPRGSPVQAPSAVPQFYFLRGGSLRGNGLGTVGSGSQTGDPRSLNEQLRLQRYRAATDSYTFGSDEDQNRFYDTGLNNNSNNVPARSSLGWLGSTASNNVFVDPSGGTPISWPDWSGTGPGDAQAFAFIRDGPMQTVGELGHVYDPARLRNANAPRDVIWSRGGARSLKIGQIEAYNQTQNPRGLWDTNGAQTNASRNWTSWRLADVFCVTPPDRNGNNQVDAEELTQVDGLVNINGVARDSGRTLRALVQGLTMQASDAGGAPSTAGRLLNTNNFTNAIVTRVVGSQTNNPSDDNLYWERGEISESAMFSFGTDLLAGSVQMQSTLDRGREEVVRRLMDLICTKGNTYSVYAVGQSLDPRTGRPLATQRVKATFRINPVFASPLPGDGEFDPSNANDRFRRPDRFSNSVLYYAFQ